MKLLTAIFAAAVAFSCGNPLAMNDGTAVTGDETPVTYATPAAAESPIHPIIELNIRGLLGGSRDGKWLTAAEVAGSLDQDLKYSIFSLPNTNSGTMTIPKPVLEPPCEEFYFIGEGDRDRAVNAIAIGENAAWQLQPRPVSEIARTSAVYQKAASELLAKKQLKRPPVNIDHIFQADLDGDGTNEVLISATHYKQGLMSRGSFNDYSFVLLRKVVNGKVHEEVLAGDFGSSAAGMNTPAQFKLSAIADLNGDGKMEVVIFAEYYEGSWIEVYEIDGNEAKLVEPLKIACGV